MENHNFKTGTEHQTADSRSSPDNDKVVNSESYLEHKQDGTDSPDSKNANTQATHANTQATHANGAHDSSCASSRNRNGTVMELAGEASQDGYNIQSPDLAVGELLDENCNLLSENSEKVVNNDHGYLSKQDDYEYNRINSQQSSENNESSRKFEMKNGKHGGRPRRKKRDSESELPIGFEGVLMEVGSPGKYVVYQIILHCLCVYSLSSNALIYVFSAYETPHSCQKLANESELLSTYGLDNSSAEILYDECSISVLSNQTGQVETMATMDCIEGHDYKGYKHISFVSEWDMVCGNVGLKELVQTILMVGQFFGAVVFTSIADRFGRKPVFLACQLLLGAVGFGVAYSPNIYVQIVFRFFVGVFQQGTSLTSFTIIIEWLTSKHRRTAAVMCGLNWTFSVLVFAMLAYLMRDYSWRNMQMVTSFFSCNVFLYPFLLTESPRWLIANKRYDQALAILKRACRFNGTDFEKVKDVFERQIVQPQSAVVLKDEGIIADVPEPKVEKYSILDILKHRKLLVSSLIIWFTWCTNSVTYYGLFLSSSSLAGNRHLNFFLMGLVDIPADIVNLIAFAYFGRKPVLMSYLIVTGCGLFTSTMFMAVGTSELTQTLAGVFSLVGKFGISACFNGIYMYTPELFPTNLRSAGLGACSSVARLGGMIAPYSQALMDVVLWGPGTLFAAMCFLSAIMIIKLPETRGQPLPTTVREMKQMVSKKYVLKKADLLDLEVDIVVDDKPSKVAV